MPPRRKRAVDQVDENVSDNVFELVAKKAKAKKAANAAKKEEPVDEVPQEEQEVIEESESKTKSSKTALKAKAPKATGKRAMKKRQPDDDGRDDDGEELLGSSKSVSKASKAAKEAGNKNKKGKLDSKRFSIVAMNVNGIRAFTKKPEAQAFLKSDLVQSCDVLCLQETKCEEIDKIDPIYNNLWGVESTFPYLAQSSVKGFHGVLTVCKREPIKVDYEDFKDVEGRIVAVHFPEFILVNVYVPNSGMGLKRLDYRMDWDIQFRAYLKKLVGMNKNLIVTGDLNCAHKEIDIANPKTNVKNAGFTPQERASFTQHLESGLIDSFRVLNPDKAGAYTFWSMRSGSARANNVGWRLDYFLISPALRQALVDSKIHPDVKGSDHCPISLQLDID